MVALLLLQSLASVPGYAQQSRLTAMVTDGMSPRVVGIDVETRTVLGSAMRSDGNPNQGFVDCTIGGPHGKGFASRFSFDLTSVDLSSTPPLISDTILVSTRALDLDLSPDGRFLLVGGTRPNDSESRVSAVDLELESEVSSASLPGEHWYSLEACSGGSVLVGMEVPNRVHRLVLGQDGSLTDTKEERTIPVLSQGTNLACSPDGTKGVVVYFRSPGVNGLTSFEVEGLSILDSIEFNEPDLFFPASAVRFSPDGTQLFTVGSSQTHGQEEVNSFTFDPATGTMEGPTWTATFDHVIFSAAVSEALELTPDGSQLYVSSGSGVLILDPNTGDLLQEIEFPEIDGSLGVCFGDVHSGNTVAEIPTLSSTGAISLALFLAFAGLATLRRRWVGSSLPPAQ